MGGFFSYFFFRKLEVVIVGLENSGKTTLVSVLSGGTAPETVPTVGLAVKVFKKGSIQLKCWDLGGQTQYRSEWARYSKGCDVIIFVVDSNAVHLLPDAKAELSRLLEDPELAKTPILVVCNKIDLNPHVSEIELVKGYLVSH
jgi:ADP-ribosylation factor-like protein 8